MSDQTFTIHGYPCEVVSRNGWTSTHIGIFQFDRERGVVTVSSPGDLSLALKEWADTLTLPTTNRHGEPESLNAWSVTVVKPASGRWPQGYKQAGEATHTFVVGYPVPQDVLDGLDAVDDTPQVTVGGITFDTGDFDRTDLSVENARIVAAHPDAFQLGIEEADSDLGMTYDGDPSSDRSVAYDLGRNVGQAVQS